MSYSVTSTPIQSPADIYFHQHSPIHARRADSDGSMSASGSAGPGFDPGEVVNFHMIGGESIELIL